MPDRADERRRAIWPARRLTGEKSRPDLVQGWGQGHGSLGFRFELDEKWGSRQGLVKPGNLVGQCEVGASGFGLFANEPSEHLDDVEIGPITVHEVDTVRLGNQQASAAELDELAANRLTRNAGHVRDR